MQIEGKKYKCDRCGAEIFVERDKDLIMDGGFTTLEMFERANDWTRQNDGKEWKDLCPACSEKLQRVIDKFWENKQEE